MLVKVSLACLAISLIVTSNMYSEAAGTVPITATPTAPTQKPTTAPTQKPTAATTQKPTTAPTTAPTQKPTTAPTTAPTQKPTTAPTTAPIQKPTTAPTTKSTQKPTTAPTTKPTTGTPAVTPSTSNPVPLGFSYSCDSNGDLTVDTAELKSYGLKVLSPLKSNCRSINQSSTYNITGCGKNTDIVVLLERKHEKSIIGGKSREFKLYCHDSTDPYVVNVTLSAVNVTEPTSYTSLPTVSPSKSKVSLTMNIYEKGTSNEVTNAVIGQEMTLTIKNTGVDTIHPTQCYATHGSESYMFWSEQGCETDETLVGHQWQKGNNSVSIALYAFHFENSHDVGIMCSVRVCPQGYSRKDCDLMCNKTQSGQNGKRRRRAAMAKDIHTVNVRTQIHVVDTEPVTASAKGLAVNTFFVLASSIFVKLYQW